MKYQQRGFTFVELLVTLVLSSVIIAAVSGVFMQSKSSFNKQQVLSNMVEDGRFAMEILAQEFRRAGFLVNPRRSDGQGYDRSDIFARLDDAANSGIALNQNEYVRGTFSGVGIGSANDINHVVFRYQLDPGGVCDDPLNPGIPPIRVNKAECLENGLNWTPSVTNQDAGNTPCSSQISDEDGVTPGSAFTKVVYFFVNNTGAGPTLSCQAESRSRGANGTVFDDNGKNTIPLVSNVEAMHVRYGEDTDADNSPNRYVLANNVTDWGRVVGVRIYLVLRSQQTNVAMSNTSTYKIDGVDNNVTSPGDKRLYRVFSTTVAFRN